MNPTTLTFTGSLFETAAGDNGSGVFVALPARDSDEILEMAPLYSSRATQTVGK